MWGQNDRTNEHPGTNNWRTNNWHTNQRTNKRTNKFTINCTNI